MTEIIVGDRVYYLGPGEDEEIGPGTVTALETTTNRSSAAYVEFGPPEGEDPDGAEADWIDLIYLRRIQDG